MHLFYDYLQGICSASPLRERFKPTQRNNKDQIILNSYLYILIRNHFDVIIKKANLKIPAYIRPKFSCFQHEISHISLF